MSTDSTLTDIGVTTPPSTDSSAHHTDDTHHSDSSDTYPDNVVHTTITGHTTTVIYRTASGTEVPDDHSVSASRASDSNVATHVPQTSDHSVTDMTSRSTDFTANDSRLSATTSSRGYSPTSSEHPQTDVDHLLLVLWSTPPLQKIMTPGR